MKGACLETFELFYFIRYYFGDTKALRLVASGKGKSIIGYANV